MATIQSIIIRPERRVPPVKVNEALILDSGIEGDHYDKPDGLRQVTLIAGDQLAKMAASIDFHGDAHLACRRNIMIDTLPQTDLQGKQITIGDHVILEITGYCAPCKRMEENFGEGAVTALSEKAGWSAKVISAGPISIGDVVNFL